MDDELDIFYNQNKASTVKVTFNKEQSEKKRPKSGKPPPPAPEQKPQQQQKTIPMISMKAFMFNFKKFYKEKTKIRNLISENSAKQRTISNKIYLRNYFSSYKEVKTMILQTNIQEVKMLQRFEDLAFRNVAEQPDTRIYVKNEETDLIAQMCRESLQELFLQKESAFYEKRVICKFLITLMQTEHYVPIGYPDLINKYKDLQAINSIYLQTIGQFIKGISQTIKNQAFKLVDVAHYLYQQKYRRQDVELIMKFMSKVKEGYNKSLNRAKDEQIDGDKLLSFELITNTFTILSNKDKTNFELIKELLSNIRFLINDQIKIDTVERVQKVMEYNIIGDYIYKYFTDLDQQIANHLTFIDQISNLIYSIEKLNLPSKQDQLEVLLGYIHRIQEHQIEEKTAAIAQKHAQLLANLVNKFEQTIEESLINKNKKTQKNASQISHIQQMPIVKQVLYDDDVRDLDAQEFANPYKIQTSDQPVRKPKIINMNSIKPSQNSIPVNQIEDEEFNGYIEKEYDKDDLILSQIHSKQTSKIENQRIQISERDLLYEREFEKFKHESQAQNKDQMIQSLQHQIKELKQQVSSLKT